MFGNILARGGGPNETLSKHCVYRMSKMRKCSVSRAERLNNCMRGSSLDIFIPEVVRIRRAF